MLVGSGLIVIDIMDRGAPVCPVRTCNIGACVAGRAGPICRKLLHCIPLCRRGGLISQVLVAIQNLVTAPHADVAADAHATALLIDKPAERGALGQAGKLFGTEDMERHGLDLQAEVYAISWSWGPPCSRSG